MGPEQMEAGSDKEGLEQIGTWGNKYLGQMCIWGNGYLGKIYIWGKWALVQIGTKANGHSGKRGTPSARCPFSPNVCKWALGKMDTWGKWTFGGKGHPKCPKEVPQVPYAHFPQMFTSGHWGKWALGENVHLGERGTPRALKGYPKCPMPISLKYLQMGTGANGHWGKCTFGGKWYPKCPMPIYPKC